ncbi:MAG: hypothetical protein ACKOTZ_05910 [Chloroflexota bacterium]
MSRSVTSRRSSRALRLGLVVALLALPLGVLPARAYQQTIVSGAPGVYTIDDTNGQAGATCTLQAKSGVNSDNLVSIRIRGFYAHGNSASKRYVGYRYLITKKAAAASTYTNVFTSTIRKQLASTSTATYFAERTFQFAAPVANDGARYRVQIRLFWYAADGTTVSAKAGGPLEVYNHVMTGASSYVVGSEGNGGYCKANFHF